MRLVLPWKFYILIVMKSADKYQNIPLYFKIFHFSMGSADINTKYYSKYF